MSDGSESLSDAESLSVDDDIEITRVLGWEVLDDGNLEYVCMQPSGEEGTFDRSDLMDGAKNQRLVMNFEKYHPPPWDAECPMCEGQLVPADKDFREEGCEECECEECGDRCRFINGLNYGCERHPVI
jgi:hypothetical protein